MATFSLSWICIQGTYWMMRIINLLLGVDNLDFLSVPVFENILISAVNDPNARQRMGYHVAAELPTDRPRVMYTHLPATHLPKSLWNTDGVKVQGQLASIVCQVSGNSPMH